MVSGRILKGEPLVIEGRLADIPVYSLGDKGMTIVGRMIFGKELVIEDKLGEQEPCGR